MRTFAALLTVFTLMFSSPAWAIDFDFTGDEPVDTGPKTATDKIVDRFMELDLDGRAAEALAAAGGEAAPVPAQVEGSEPATLKAEGSKPEPMDAEAIQAPSYGAVSFAEYMVMVQARAEARFASMDANGDGGVTADEYRDFWKAQKSQYYRLKR